MTNHAEFCILMHVGDPRGRHRQALAGVAVRLQSAAHDTGDTFD
ncbi:MULTISPECIES: hypothetical protein [Streptomyces]|nr:MULTISPECIES: hypothetical protein [Streptomyces]